MTTTTPNHTLSLSQIDAKIRGIAQSAKNLRESSQDTAIAVMRHCTGDGRGDCTRALRLVLALPPRLQGKMVLFFRDFSPIRVTVNAKDPKKNSVRLAKIGDKSFTDWDIDTALTVNWQDHGTAPKEKKPFNLNSFRADLQKVLKKYEKLIADGEAGDAEEIREDIAAFHTAAQTRGRAAPTPLVDAPRLVA